MRTILYKVQISNTKYCFFFSFQNKNINNDCFKVGTLSYSSLIVVIYIIFKPNLGYTRLFNSIKPITCVGISIKKYRHFTWVEHLPLSNFQKKKNLESK